jgi:hypothetical protein
MSFTLRAASLCKIALLQFSGQAKKSNSPRGEKITYEFENYVKKRIVIISVFTHIQLWQPLRSVQINN